MIEETTEFHNYVYLYNNNLVQRDDRMFHSMNTIKNFEDEDFFGDKHEKFRRDQPRNFTLYNKRDLASEMSSDNKWNLRLCLFNTLVYMTNNFMFYPSFFTYLEKLEINGVYCGLILSIEHLICLMNFIIYDYCIKSFKLSFVVSIMLMIISNAFYIYALQAQSISLLIISRIFFGLGNFQNKSKKYLEKYTPFYIANNYSNSYSLFSASGIILGKLSLDNFRIYCVIC